MANFLIPWTPTLDGEVLPPSKVLAKAEELAPPRGDDPIWGREAVTQQLVNLRPMEIRAIKASMDALWEVNQTQEDGMDDPEWARHALAWLVRSHSFIA